MHPRDFDPFAPETIEEPHAFYRAMREEAPVYRSPGADWHYVTRYADIKRVAMDPETFSSNIVAILVSGGGGRLAEVVSPKLPFLPEDVLAVQDPPHHRRQRKATTTGMGRDFQRDLEPHVRELVSRLLDGVVGQGTVDWMEHVAFRVPMEVALAVLSLPLEERARVKGWSDRAIALLAGVNTRPQMAGLVWQGIRFYRWCVRRFREARRDPPGGLMGTLVAWVEAGELTEREAASMILQILIAGSDSSASLMGSAVQMLAGDSELQAELRARPDRIPAFVEEAMRLESPFQGHFRQTKRPCELAGVGLPAGARLFLTWGSGNRDEAQFTNPDRIDLDRPNPRAHFSFGHGIHLCVGAPLGRMEARVVLEELLARTRSVEAVGRRPRHRPSIFVRTLETLPIQAVPA